MEINIFSILKKLINIVLDFFIVILAGVLVIVLYNNIQIYFLGHSYSSFLGYSLFEVQTGSMEDYISAGDWIVVKYEKDIKLDDVITFQSGDSFVTHRVVEKYNDTYVTRGDANNSKDKEPVAKDQVVGKVVKILPTFGILRKTIFNPIVLIGFILILYLLTSIFKKKDDDIKDGFVISTFENTVKKDNKSKKLSKIDVERDKKEHTKVINVEDLQNTKGIPAVPVVDEETDNTDKTMLFRVVSVDEEDYEEVYSLSVLDEVEEKAQEIPVINTEDEEIASEEKVKMTLELIQKKRKKCNNFIEKAVLLKREEIEEIVSILNLKQKYKVNEPTIKDQLCDIYIEAKYYNNCAYGEFDSNVKVTASKVEKTLLDCSINLFKAYKGTDDKYHDKLKKFLKMVVLINKLEEDYKIIIDLDKKKSTYEKKILRYLKYDDLPQKELKAMINNIIKVQRSYAGMMKFLFNKLDSGMFKLGYKAIGKDAMFIADLEHNLTFSKMYSDYIVDKTYSEGIVAEDKIEVVATLLSSQLVKDMLDKSFNKKYLVEIPSSLFSKGKKLEKIINMFNDNHAKKSVIFLVDLEGINDNKKYIKLFIKDGYHFSTDLSGVKNIRKKDENSLYLVDYIIFDKDETTDLLSEYPDEIKNKLIIDKALNKVKKG